ncbi:MAG: hypothetical protein J7K35_06295 [Syntrophobacterales bacterium]|nr:hypothetical protein [Syntrophobacterales bacterium]
MMKRDSLWIILIITVFSLAVFCSGCGKKADPRYLNINYPEPVSDLDVSIDKDGIVLKWSIPGERVYAGHVRILKSALRTDDDNCPDCPRIYVIAGDLPLRDLRRDEKRKFIYLDRSIRRGFSYAYRIMICDSSDMCGEESNTARVEIP